MMRERAAGDELADRVAGVVFARVLSSVTELASVAVVARELSKGEFALIFFLLLCYQTARYFATLGLPESVFYFFERIPEGSRRAFALQTAGVLGAFGALAGLALLGLGTAAPFVLSSKWDASGLTHFAELVPWIALVAVLEIPTWPLGNVLLATGHHRGAAWYQIACTVGAFVALVGPILLGLGIDVAVYGLAVYAILRFVASAFCLHLILPARDEPLPQGTLRRQLRFSFPLGLNALASRLNKYVDKYVVAALLSAAAFAEFNLGGQEIPMVQAIPYAAGSVFITSYVQHRLRGDKDALVEVWHRGIRGVSLVVVPVALFFIVAAQDAVPLLFGARYEAAVLPFQIYTVILLHRVAQYGALMQAFDDNRVLLYITATMVIANLSLSIPFTYFLGIGGTALATLISALLGWGLYLRRIGRHLETGIAGALPWGFYGRVLGVAGLAGVVAYGVRVVALGSAGPGTGLALSAFVFFGLYGTVATVAGLIHRRHWGLLAGWLRLNFLWR